MLLCKMMRFHLNTCVITSPCIKTHTRCSCCHSWQAVYPTDMPTLESKASACISIPDETYLQGFPQCAHQYREPLQGFSKRGHTLLLSSYIKGAVVQRRLLVYSGAVMCNTNTCTGLEASSSRYLYGSTHHQS